MTKKDFLKIVLFLFLPIPVLYLGSFLIDKGLQNSRSKNFTVWNEIRKGVNADVVIMGASRAWVHISPKILDSALNINSYNIGLDNWCFLMQNCRFNVFLEHNPKPKFVIHSLDYLMFDKNKELYGDIQFVPYFNDKTIMEATKGYVGSFNMMQRYVPMYKYRNNGELMLEGLAGLFNIQTNPENLYKGYEGMEKEWDSTFADFVHQHPEGYKVNFDSTVVNQFEQYLQFCTNNNIKVVLTYTPEYYKAQEITQNRKEEFDLYRYFAQKYNCIFLDYSSDSLCYNSKYFYNSQHLNKEGSEVFSKRLATDLAPYIKYNSLTATHN